MTAKRSYPFIEFIFNPGLWGNKIINLRNVACHVTHVYYRSAPTGAMGAGIINMRKSTLRVDFHMLIMNSPQMRSSIKMIYINIKIIVLFSIDYNVFGY